MIFTPVELSGAWLVEPERLVDERGFFARSFCQKEFTDRGLNPNIVQCSISFNVHRGTVRGMHYQLPRGEAKLVRCSRGAIFDVIIDLRPQSPTYKEHFGVVLSEDNRRMLYVPEEFAHGFQTMEECTEVFYQMSEFYYPENAHGVRWDDPAFAIQWPYEVVIISDRDRTYPDFIL